MRFPEALRFAGVHRMLHETAQASIASARRLEHVRIRTWRSRTDVQRRYGLVAHGKPNQPDDDHRRVDARWQAAAEKALAGDRFTLPCLPAFSPEGRGRWFVRVLADRCRFRYRLARAQRNAARQ